MTARNENHTIDICIIHNIADNMYFNKILKHLNPFEKKYNVKIWHLHKILGGDSSKKILREEIVKSDVFIPLLSPDFLADEKYEDIIQIIKSQQENRQLRVISVWVRPCQWEITFFKNLEILPNSSYSLNDDYWNSIDHGIDVVVKELKMLLFNEGTNKNVTKKISNKLNTKEEKNIQQRFFMLVGLVLLLYSILLIYFRFDIIYHIFNKSNYEVEFQQLFLPVFCFITSIYIILKFKKYA